MRDSHNFLSLCLQLIASNCNDGVKQACAIYFKNWVHKQWEPFESTSVINENDKQVVRSHILKAMMHSNRQVQAMLCSSLYFIVRADFPKKYPELSMEIFNLLQSSDTKAVETGLLALQQVLKFQGYEEKAIYDQVVEQSFPFVLKIAASCIDSNELAAFGILKTILKIFTNVIQYEMPKYLTQPAVFMPWFELFMHIFAKKETAEVASLHDDDRSSSMFWKMKKWCLHVFNRLFCRYGNPYMDTSSITEFSKFFMLNYVPGLCNALLRMIMEYIEQRAFITERIKCLLSDFLSPCVRCKVTWPILKPHVMAIIKGFIFPECCFSEADQELWEDNPYEYVHTKLDPLNDEYNSSTAMSNLLSDIVRGRKKITLMPTLGFFNEILAKYQQHPSEEMARQKDGVLYLIGTLETVVMKTEVAKQMELFLKTHVVPELKSPFAYLRARACWILQNFDGIEYANEYDPVSIFQLVAQECLQHKDLPVKIEAAMAIGSLMDYETVKQAMIPVLPNIMQVLLALTNESDIDALSFVMEKLVETFPNELSPFAIQMTRQLKDNLLRLLQAIHQNKETEEMEKSMTAIGIIKTIGTLADTLKGQQLSECQEEIIVILAVIFENDIIDVYEEAFELFEQTTFSLKVITESCWKLFPLLYKCFKEYPMDYLDELTACMDNYISFGGAALASKPEYMQIIIQIIQTIFQDESFQGNDLVNGCKLVESFCLNCRALIDPYIPAFMDLVLAKLASFEKGVVLMVYLLESIINCILYNPKLALHVLESKQATAFFFSKWIENIDQFSRVHDKKLIIMAIKEMFVHIPFSTLPDPVKTGFNHISLALLNALVTLPKAVEERKKLEEEYDEDDDDYDYEDYEEEAEEEDEIYQPESIAMNKKAVEAYNDDDYDDDDGSFFDEELEEELFFVTPLDNIDIKNEVKSALVEMEKINQESYARLLASFNEEQKQQLISILQ